VKLLRHGFTKAEETELLLFCLSGTYPNTHTVARTGTTFKIGCENDAAHLYKNLTSKAKADKAFGKYNDTPGKWQVCERTIELFQYNIDPRGYGYR
jgi:hypothetical protein